MWDIEQEWLEMGVALDGPRRRSGWQDRVWAEPELIFSYPSPFSSRERAATTIRNERELDATVKSRGSLLEVD